MKLLLVLLPIFLFAFSPQQKANYWEVHQLASQFTDYPSTIAAIFFVETSLGTHPRRINDDGRSFGDMQIQVSTVRWLADMYPDLSWLNTLTDLDIAKFLLTRRDFSVLIACIYFEHYRQAWGFRRAVMMYNGGVNNWTYYNKVMEARKLLQKEM